MYIYRNNNIYIYLFIFKFIMQILLPGKTYVLHMQETRSIRLSMNQQKKKIIRKHTKAVHHLSALKMTNPARQFRMGDIAAKR